MGLPAATTWPEAVLHRLELSYGVVLLFVFVFCIAVNSIWETKHRAKAIRPSRTGPGGRPLPVSRRKSQDNASLNSTDSETIGLPIKRVYAYTCSFIILSFILNFVNITVRVVSESRNPKTEYGWWCGEELIVYLVSGMFIHIYVLLYLLEASGIPNIPVAIFWLLSLLYEIALFVINIVRVTGRHHVLQSLANDVWTMVRGPDQWDYIDLGISCLRIALNFFLVAIYMSVCLSRSMKHREKLERESRVLEVDEASVTSDSTIETVNENTPLMNGDNENQAAYDTAAAATNGQTTTLSRHGSSGSESADVGSHSLVNGSANGSSNGFPNGCANGSKNGSAVVNETAGDDDCDDGSEGEGTAFYRPHKLPHKTWWEYLTSYSLFFPYLWPRDSSKLQLVVLLCFVILIIQRVVNFLVPNQIGNITDAFEAHTGLPWAQILTLIVYKVLQGQSGLLGSLRSLLWIPVSQYSYRALTTAAFEHVHSLSLDFHLGKRTGEVLSALNKGAAINSFLEQVTFQVFPMLVDLLVAIIYFLIRFGAIYATIAAIITVFYLHMTVKMASTRADLRRDMVNADREEEAVKNDSITSYETVKYFNAEAFEFDRYRKAIVSFQTAEAKVTWGMNNMTMYQSAVFMCGILVMLMVAAVEVNQGLRSIGDFVVMITYLGQLQGPLNFFGSFYRTVQQAMISGERLLELFKIHPTVIDGSDVSPLTVCSGHIRWNNVKFWYDKKRPALQNLSFDCWPGTTTAFVGESGGGKSTIFRLMFRYYNCQEGNIVIDGHDVKDLTIDSVRRHIGVVPQDTILFNETIMYNLKYANPSVTDEDVFEACRVASIHDRILSFTDGYNTKVGDRGTRLSGGEKQRVAIARAILKNPKIIMLDEATSALDSETEQQIQAKLIRGGSLGQDRTLLIIAHRLSTITHADQIIVLHAGAIVEKGTHNELLALKGRYASMWEQQSQAEQAAVAARNATARAKHLLRKAHISNSPTMTRPSDEASDGYTSMSSSTILATVHTTPRQGSIARSDEFSDDDGRNSQIKL